MDGVGEWATTSVGDRPRQRLCRCIKEIHFPHSLGLLYSAFTYYTGFKVNSGEYKVMGLAPYGEPKYAKLILDNLIDLKPDGSFRLELDYFDYCTGLTMTNGTFDALFGGAPRKPEELLTQRHMDLAASIQAVTEEVVLRLTRSLADEDRAENLCLAGGVALNCVANGKVLRDGTFEQIWIQPAAGDAGGALGAALAAYHLQRPAAAHAANGAGRHARRLSRAGLTTTSRYRAPARGCRRAVQRLDEDALIERDGAGARERAGGRLVSGPHGIRPARARRPLDPRRSALADHAEDAQPQGEISRKSSGRSRRRCCASDVADWFELDADSPYMLLVADVTPERRRAMTERGAGAVRHRQAQCARARIFRRSPMSIIRRAFRPCTPRPIRASTR